MLSVLTTMASLGVGALPASAAQVVSSSYSHAGGALATKVTADLSWLNRSVQLGNVQFYVMPSHCARFNFWGYWGKGREVADIYSERICTTSSTGGWYSFGSETLDGSSRVGGISKVAIDVIDETHNGMNTFTTYRE
ncbi:hypothetical protein [Micromonospora sp. C28ISP2-4]|uniref:hypothetical protein n=1 Tax=Micromonospora sp. C28ISP2-4 TaxID=3059523 RepID=UPI0026751A23|nr:hypothetical protein [Micromonospora sp. C28ISP2-4]MDO3683948.1 hypothetical protein [Micromonospora sp. C28ISP2-4]